MINFINLITVFVLPFFLAIIITPFIIKFAMKKKIYDHPDKELKSHDKPTPYMGGIAVYLSILPFFITNISYIVPATIMLLLGFLDDIKDVNPKIRLLIEFITIGMTSYLVWGKDQLPFLYMVLITFTGVALINAVNFIDGMDGICSGTSMITILFFAIVSKNYSLFVIVAALAGFLVYNFNPAKIFLGDAGSYLLGFTIFYSFSFMTHMTKNGVGGYFISLIITGIFFTDLIYSIIRRVSHKKSPLAGDRDHVYDKVKRKTKASVRVTAIILYSMTAIFGLIGFYGWNYPIWSIIIAGLYFLAVGFIFKLYNYK